MVSCHFWEADLRLRMLKELVVNGRMRTWESL